MKREVKKLLQKSIESLILSIEIFNRPSDTGRCTASLIFMDHSFEMLLKAAILHRNGEIREKRHAPNTIGFDKCLRKALSDATLKFITEEQALSLQIINGERDAAQHYILEISEPHLYILMQGGFTLFSDILKNVFNKTLNYYFPSRVLPIATMAPMEIEPLFRFEIKEIKKLLEPNTRTKSEAIARLRPLAILNSAILGEKNTQLSERDMEKLAAQVKAGKSWDEIFPGVAKIQLTRDGQGQQISLRITKKGDVEVALVKEGKTPAGVVAVKTVNALEYYNLGCKQMCGNIKKQHPNINQTKLLAIIKHLKIQHNPEYFKLFKINSQTLKRYSGKAQKFILEQIPLIDVEANWRTWK